MLISSCKSTKLQLAVKQPSREEIAGAHYKRYPSPKTRKKPQQDDRKGTVTIKSNPVTTRWVAHKPENNNPKEVLPLLWCEPHVRLPSPGI